MVLTDEPERRTPFPGQNAPQRQQIKLSPEELRVLKECNRESFFKRCIPFSAFLAASTYVGIKNGFLKPSIKYGASPKVSIAVIVGYFLGKFSYQSKCAEKLMQLPNSALGDVLRQRRRGNQESFDGGFGSAISLAPFGNISSSDVYSDDNPSSGLDIDTSRPDNPGLDDYHRPSMDNPVFEEDEMPPMQKYATTYDELRKKNREEYHQKLTGNYKVEQPTASRKPTSESMATDNEFDNKNRQRSHKNKYGDDFE